MVQRKRGESPDLDRGHRSDACWTLFEGLFMLFDKVLEVLDKLGRSLYRFIALQELSVLDVGGY